MNVHGGIQVVIPMAGLGQRFTELGYKVPKPLLPIHDIPMYKVVVANLISPQVSRIILIAQAAWGLSAEVEKLNQIIPQEILLIEIDHVTDGPAATVILAQNHLDAEMPVVIGNSDQYIDSDLDIFYSQLKRSDIDGSILTMEDDNPKWSYAMLDDQGFVLSVKEKEVISRYATVGVYSFISAAKMFRAFEMMKDSFDTVNGEYYVAPSYNYLISAGSRISILHLGPIEKVVHGLGIPADYQRFMDSPISSRAALVAREMFM